MANANANANDEIYKHEKTIILNKLVPSEYRMWVVQAEATLGVYEYLGIICGKAPETTMDDHINQFTKLCQKVEYYKPPNAQDNTDGMANLAFLSSLSGLKEWSLFGLAKGANINNMTSAALFAEVKAYDATLNPPKPSTETTSDQAKALYSNIHDQ